MYDWQELTVLFCHGVMVAWTAGFALTVLGAMLIRLSKDSPLPSVIRFASNTWHRWFNCSYGLDANDRAKQQLDERRDKGMQSIACALLFVTFWNSLIILSTLGTRKPRWYRFEMDIASVLTSLVTVVFNACPTLMKQLPRGFYSVWMTFLCLHFTPLTTQVDPFWNDVLFTARAILRLAILDQRLVLFWNLTYGTAAWCQIHFVWQHRQCGDMNMNPYSAAMKELTYLSFIVGMCINYKEVLSSAIMERIGGSASKSECRAATCLLNAMSDVVVKLDSALRIMDDSPTFSAFLLRGSGGESVCGAQFESFMCADGDKHLFRDCIDTGASKHESDHRETEAVVPIRIRFRDGRESFVTTECFHTALEDVAGSVFHIVGFREVQAESKVNARHTRQRGSGPPAMQQNSVGEMVLPVANQATAPANVCLNLANQRAVEDNANAPQPQPRPVSVRQSDQPSGSYSSFTSPSSGPRTGNTSGLHSSGHPAPGAVGSSQINQEGVLPTQHGRPGARVHGASVPQRQRSLVSTGQLDPSSDSYSSWASSRSGSRNGNTSGLRSGGHPARGAVGSSQSSQVGVLPTQHGRPGARVHVASAPQRQRSPVSTGQHDPSSDSYSSWASSRSGSRNGNTSGLRSSGPPAPGAVGASRSSHDGVLPQQHGRIELEL